MTSSTSITSASCSQQSSTWSMAAMSAIEQPAFRSGRTTVTRWPPRRWTCSGRLARMSAVSAMKCTPQKAIARHSSSAAARAAELIAVAAEVGQGDHLVLLVMMPQDQEPPAHVGADLLDPLGENVASEFLIRLQLVGRSGGVEKGGHGDSLGRWQERYILAAPLECGNLLPLFFIFCFLPSVFSPLIWGPLVVILMV